MKKVISIIAVALLLPALSNAQILNSLIRETNPAAAGLAGASVAMQADAYALQNNPAAMSLSADKGAFAVGYGILQPQTVKMGALSAAGMFKLSEKFALGAGFQRFGYQPYAITSEEGRSSAEFTPSEMAFSLGASYQIVKGLSAGVKLNYASLALSPDSKKGVFCGDIGLTYTTGTITAAVNARNLGSSVMDIRAGASYSIASISAYAQGEYLAGAGIMAAVGAQYSFRDMLFARAGFHYGDAQKGIPSYGSLGLGGKFKGITLDAAYLLGAKGETGTMLFSLGYSF